MELLFLPEAEDDLRAAWFWYVQEAAGMEVGGLRAEARLRRGAAQVLLSDGNSNGLCLFRLYSDGQVPISVGWWSPRWYVSEESEGTRRHQSHEIGSPDEDLRVRPDERDLPVWPAELTVSKRPARPAIERARCI